MTRESLELKVLKFFGKTKSLGSGRIRGGVRPRFRVPTKQGNPSPGLILRVGGCNGQSMSRGLCYQYILENIRDESMLS